MAFWSFLDPALNAMFGWLLLLTPFWGVLIISLIISVLITLIYKWMTDQNLMKQLKTELKEFQKQIKELRQHPEKAMAVQKKAMETNMKYMMQSMKPTLVTFIPIILIFGWLNAHMAYYPIMPGQEFTATVTFDDIVNGQITLNTPNGIVILGNSTQDIGANQARWVLEAEKDGEYLLDFVYKEKSYTKDLIISSARDYAQPELRIRGSDIKTITVEHKPIKIMNLFGWKVGWLGGYIIFSIVFSLLLRKMLKLY